MISSIITYIYGLHDKAHLDGKQEVARNLKLVLDFINLEIKAEAQAFDVQKARIKELQEQVEHYKEVATRLEEQMAKDKIALSWWHVHFGPPPGSDMGPMIPIPVSVDDLPSQ